VEDYGLSDDLVVLGCPSCDSYGGRVTILNRTNMEELFSHVGSIDSDNHFIGAEIEIVSFANYSIIVFSSQSHAPLNSRDFYINYIQAVKDPLTLQYEIKIAHKAVNQPAATSFKTGISVGTYGQFVIFKYISQYEIVQFLGCGAQE